MRQRLLRVDVTRIGHVRGRPGEHERDPLAFADGEACHGGEPLTVRGDGRDEPEDVGSADRLYAALDRAHPRDDRAVAEADDELHLHRNVTAVPDDDARDIGPLAGDGHQIDERDASLFRFVLRLEDERALAVPPADAPHSTGRRNLPAPVLA